MSNKPDLPPWSMPAPEHELMEVLAGAWNAEVSFWPAPDAPPVRSTGRMESVWVLGGRFLAQTYRDAAPDSPFAGHGYMGFNTGSRMFEGFWIDTGSTCMQTETGEWDPDARRFVMRGEFAGPGDGRPVVKRSVIAVTSPDEHTMTMEMPGPDGAMRRVMEIVFRRVK